MHVEALRQLGERRITLEGGQRQDGARIGAE
jgi:hypothetical protein